MNENNRDYIVEKMCIKHIEQVADIEKECFVHPWSQASLQEELKKTGSFFYVATISGKTVGYIGMNTVLDEGYITNVAVLKEYRRKGIAKGLLYKIVDAAIQNNLSFITLEVRRSNTCAISLYSSYGFENVGERKNYYTNPTENAVLMTKYFIKP